MRDHVVAAIAAALLFSCKTVYDDEPAGGSDSACQFAMVREELTLTTQDEPRCADYVPVLTTWTWSAEADFDTNVELYSSSLDDFFWTSCSGVFRGNETTCTAHSEAVCHDGTVIQEDARLDSGVIVGEQTYSSPGGFACNYTVRRTPL